MFSEKVNAVFEDQAFTERLAALETKEDVVAAFAEKGVDFEKDIAAVVEADPSFKEELDEEALKDVSGGSIVLAAALGWAIGRTVGIAVRRTYDQYRYGDANRTYTGYGLFGR